MGFVGMRFVVIGSVVMRFGDIAWDRVHVRSC